MSRSPRRYLVSRRSHHLTIAFGAAVVAAAFAFAAGAPRAFAQDQAAVDKLIQLNKKAMDDYDTADFEPAKKALLDAEKQGKRSGLESHPIMARTYVHLGALYFVGFKDKQKAAHYFGKALDIQPDIRLDKNMTSQALKDFFNDVVSQHGAGAPPPAADDTAAAPPPSKKKKGGRADVDLSAPSPAPPRSSSKAALTGNGDPDLPAQIVALDCYYPEDAQAGRKVTFRCVAADSLGVDKVLLYYQGQGMADFESVDMPKSPKGWFAFVLPKKSVAGSSVRFYFEGLNQAGDPVVTDGRADSPHAMPIIAEAKDGAGPKKPRNEEEDPLAHLDEEVDTEYGNRRFWIGLGVGTGFVFAIGGVPESRVGMFVPPGGSGQMVADVKVNGFGWAGLGQIAPEIGVHFIPNWALSLESRDQYIPQAKKVANYTASGAHAVMLRLFRFTAQRRLRYFVGAGVGGGEGIRMNIFADSQVPEFKDTVLVGPVLVGVTPGLIYEISKGVSWVLKVNSYVGLPKAGVAFDVDTAFQFNFGDSSGRAAAEAKKRAEGAAGSVEDEDPK